MDPEENIVLVVQQKKNYQEMNMDYLQKIKQKKQREQQQKALQQKKQQEKRQKLRKKILAEASLKNRENNEKGEAEDKLTQLSKTGQRRRTNIESLPKIQNSDSKQAESEAKKDYRERYVSFLKNLNQAIKSKKQIKQQQQKKKQEKYAKLKQELGYNNVESKLVHQIKPKTGDELARSHSADKFESLMQGIQAQMPKTNKNFKKKNQQFIEKLKQKRQIEQQAKEEEKQRKDKLKDKLKEFVMVTVKKNVLEGAYDDQIERLEKKKSKKEKKGDKNVQQKEEQDENEQEQEESSSDEKEGDQKKRKKLRAFPYISDLGEWKKKNRIEPTDKVYIVTGGYGQLKSALKQREWYGNPDSSSPCFDLKYTLQGRQINFDALHDFQLVNHFQKAGCLTTKVGLTKTLRNLKYIKDLSQDNFFPKCFDLNDEDDYVGFEIHFKICKALSILKIYSNFFHGAQVSAQTRQKNKQLIDDLKLRTEVALEVCKKNIEDIDDIIDRKKIIKIVTDKEWQILAQDELNEEGLAKKKHEQWLKSIDCKFNNTSNNNKTQEPQQKKPKKKKQPSQSHQQQHPDQQQQQQQEQQLQIQNELAKQVDQLLQQYKKRFPQFSITGHDNIWILKPAGLSRGRGITCYNNLVEIQDHVKCKQSQWIAQKYIQNPLVVLKRKLDIRQWVLITDFNPLTIWLYDECYVRFSAEDYDAKNVKNKFIHLTNNSIGAYHKNFGSSHIKGNMFFQQQFSNYLQQKQGSDIFLQKIRPQIKDIVKYSMMCGMEHVENRKNTHELFGYDFMVDENYKVWLIQINSSPSMDYSTHITSKLVKECLHDIVKVIVDYANVPKKDKKSVDTGKWKRIYKGIQIPDKPISTGLNLCLEGIPMKKPKRNTAKITNFSLDK